MQTSSIYNCIPRFVYSYAFAASCYTGKERDSESGLDNFGARYYGSTMGRFMSPDPSGLMFADPTNPQSLNLYSYALNNPLKNTDPTGMYCIYFGETDESMDGATLDAHSDQATCEGNSSEGGGKWVDDPHTEVNVSANGDGSIGSYSSSFDGTAVIPYEQYSQWQGDPDDKRIQTLSQDITTDVQQETGCIVQAYKLEALALIPVIGGAPVPGSKPHAGWGYSQGTSLMNKYVLGPMADQLGVPRGRFPSPTGGLMSAGKPFTMNKTANLGRAAGRWAPYVGTVAATAAAASGLWNCLSGH